MSRILIVEDDDSIAGIERDYLEKENYEVTVARDSNQGLTEGLSGRYNLILLDLMLPGIGGFALCKKYREKTDIPILMVTALQEDSDKIKGLGCGADDYIAKPFSPKVLVARVKANLAQYQRLKHPGTVSPTLSFGELEINTESKRVFVHGKEVELKHMEYELLVFLAEHEDMVFSRETLYERVWGIDATGDTATVAVHINRLREKLEDDPGNPKHILTVWGTGYRFHG
jgi:DNA-binding response OmpR family regulator